MDTNNLNKDILAKAENLCMEFTVPRLKIESLKERVINLLKFKRQKKEVFNVLNNINFEIKRGESLGVIGHNGAGKSTLLKLVSGIYSPTYGKMHTNGSVMLLNLGAGFDMEANAEENIYISGALLGFTRKQMKQRFNSIVEFAELQDFMKLPLKNFSSGMISRLGFAIAIDMNPDLLLVDEVLSVGDANFQRKCMNKITELKKSGVSFMFVSHNIAQVKAICEKTIWIENSQVMDYGETKYICDKYEDYCKQKLIKDNQNNGIKK